MPKMGLKKFCDSADSADVAERGAKTSESAGEGSAWGLKSNSTWSAAEVDAAAAGADNDAENFGDGGFCRRIARQRDD
jgi:hypothetical protein